MILYELYDKPAWNANPEDEGYYDGADDNSAIDDEATRKTRLTLKQINKLRRMLNLRNSEKAEQLQKIQAQYATPAQPEGAPF